jgi:hypothetical protein
MRPADRLRELQAKSSAELRQEWERVHRVPAPPTYGPDLLARGLAYRLQEKSGGLPSKIAREIRRGVAQLQACRAEPGLSPSLRIGTRLIREWHGRTHHVEVVEGGFDYQELHYRSLTAIAREITGAGWSGPRFFGLARPEAR